MFSVPYTHIPDYTVVLVARAVWGQLPFLPRMIACASAITFASFGLQVLVSNAVLHVALHHWWASLPSCGRRWLLLLLLLRWHRRPRFGRDAEAIPRGLQRHDHGGRRQCQNWRHRLQAGAETKTLGDI